MLTLLPDPPEPPPPAAPRLPRDELMAIWDRLAPRDRWTVLHTARAVAEVRGRLPEPVPPG